MSKPAQPAKLKTALQWASFAATMSWISWVPRLPEIKDQLGLSLDQLGTILMVAGLTMAFASRPTAALIHRFSSKRVILIGVVLSIWGNLVIAWASDGIFLTLGIMISSFGVGLVNTANNTQINTVSVMTGENERNRLSAYATIGTITSLVLGALLLNVLNTLQYLMLIQFFTGLVAVAVNRFMTVKDEGAAEKGTKQVKMPWFGKGTGAFWLALTALYATTLAEFSVSDWGGILARDNFHIGSPWFLIVILFFQLGMFAGRYLSSRLNKRFGEVRNVLVGTLVGATIWGIVIYAAGQLGQVNEFAALCLASFGFFCAGWGVGPNWGVLLAAATVPGYPAPVTLSRVFGLLSLVFSFGPGLVGWLAKAVGLTNAMLLPVACLALVGVLVPRVVANDRAARASA
jgi:predicted MFS family arabinose efflux permease